MSKATKGLLLLGGAAVAVYAITKVTSVVDTAKSIQIKLLSLNVKFPKLFATLQIFNPTKNEIIIDSIVGEIYFNNKSIGNIQYINKVPIAPFTYSKFSNVLVELTPMGGAVLAKEIILRTAKEGVFLVSGKVYVKGQPFPFTQTFKAF